MLLLTLTGCSMMYGTPESRTETVTLKMDDGMTLYVDATVHSGSIHVTVMDKNGTIYYDEFLEESFDCGINVYIPNTYTIRAVWDNARGKVDVYQKKTKQFFCPFSAVDFIKEVPI